MNLRSLALAAFALCCIASTASAQVSRAWVSGVGDDVNPCSRTSPCKTYQGAFNNIANGGEIDTLDGGGFGGLTITKSVTIDGSGGSIGGVLVASTHGITINAGSNDVVILRNLHINGIAMTGAPGIHGINVLQVGELHIEDCTIDAFGQDGISITTVANSKVFINRTSIRNMTGGGIRVAPGPSATAEVYVNHTELIGNGRGLRAEDGAIVTVANSSAVGNTANGFVGLALAGRPVDLTIENSVSSGNGAIGVYAGALTTAKIAGMLITRNGGGIQAVDTGAIGSLGGNKVFGNAGFNGPANFTIPQF